MSLAVTLHPFSEAEYLGWWVPVALGRLPVEHVVADVASEPGLAAVVREYGAQLPAAFAALRAGEAVPWSATVNLGWALVNAWRHPSWFLGDLGLSYWRAPGECPFRPYTRSMSVLAARARGVGAASCEVREGFAGPHSAGSYITPGDVYLLIRDIERRPQLFAERLQAAGYDVREALAVALEAAHYARERHLGVLEATHLVDPAPRTARYPLDHLRGGWRGGLNEQVLSRLDEAFAREGV